MRKGGCLTFIVTAGKKNFNVTRLFLFRELTVLFVFAFTLVSIA